MQRTSSIPLEDGDVIETRLDRVRRKRSLKRLLISLVATAAVVYLLFGMLFSIAVVDGKSMSPALEDGDVGIFQRTGVSYQTGDIVLVRADDGTEQVKRLVGLPGQTVDIDEETGSLVINDETLLEPYVYDETHGKFGSNLPLRLGDDEYYVLGDNRGNSRDSRNYGPVTEGQLAGRLLFVAFRWEG